MEVMITGLIFILIIAIVSFYKKEWTGIFPILSIMFFSIINIIPNTQWLYNSALISLFYFLFFNIIDIIKIKKLKNEVLYLVEKLYIKNLSQNEREIIIAKIKEIDYNDEVVEWK